MPARPDRRTAPYLIATVTAAVVAVGLYAPFVGGPPVSDDWPVFEAVAQSTPARLRSWLDPTADAWFRPLSLLYTGLTWRAFETDAAAHRALGVVLFGLSATALGVLAWQISGDARCAPFGALAFGLGATHAEPVLWISSHNEILAGGLFLSAILAEVRHLRGGGRVALAVAHVAGLLALCAKETAYGLPLALLCLEWRLPVGPASQSIPRPAGQPLTAGLRLLARPSLTTGLAVIVLGLARIGHPHPYGTDLAPVSLLRNGLYSMGMMLAALPADGALLAGSGALEPRVIALAAAVGSLGLIGLATLWRPWRGCTVCTRAMTVAVAMTLAGMLPALPVVTERTTYLPSMGLAVLLALLVTRLASSGVDRRTQGALVTLLFGLYLAAGSAAAASRASDWSRAARVVQYTMSDLARAASTSDRNAHVLVIGLPNRIGSAYAFQNALPAAARLWPVDRPVQIGDDAGSAGSPCPDSGHMGGKDVAGDSALVLCYVDHPRPGLALPREGAR